MRRRVSADVCFVDLVVGIPTAGGGVLGQVLQVVVLGQRNHEVAVVIKPYLVRAGRREVDRGHLVGVGEPGDVLAVPRRGQRRTRAPRPKSAVWRASRWRRPATTPPSCGTPVSSIRGATVA